MNIGYGTYSVLYKWGTTSNRLDIEFFSIPYQYTKIWFSYLAVEADARFTALRRSKDRIVALVLVSDERWVHLKLASSQNSSGSYAHRADARFTALRRSKGRIAALVTTPKAPQKFMLFNSVKCYQIFELWNLHLKIEYKQTLKLASIKV